MRAQTSAVLNFKFLTELAASNDRNFKFTALDATPKRTPEDYRHELGESCAYLHRFLRCCGATG